MAGVDKPQKKPRPAAQPEKEAASATPAAKRGKNRP
jgi:hypothetical protein